MNKWEDIALGLVMFIVIILAIEAVILIGVMLIKLIGANFA